jgi:hypothetical protein
VLLERYQTYILDSLGEDKSESPSRIFLASGQVVHIQLTG